MRSHLHGVRVLIGMSGLLVTMLENSACANQSPRHVSNRELTMQKSGSIIDATTGIGITGVKVIVNWRTASTGIAGYSSTGGSWCDLQRIVTSDDSGAYTIPDVSKDLDLSDRGTHVGATPFGVASQSHDTDYVLTVFKPGYVMASDSSTPESGSRGASVAATRSLQHVPEVSLAGGKATIKAIALRKEDLGPTALWDYYSGVSVAGMCIDRMAHNIEQPEMAQIGDAMRAAVRTMPCTMPSDSAISPDSFAVFENVSHTPATRLTFHNKVRELQGLPPPVRGYDPTERISTTAGTICQALQAESAK